MRLRLPELLEERGLTAYGLAKASGGKISIRTAYRLVQQRGNVRYFDADTLEALCRVLNVEPAELFERNQTRRAAAGRRRQRS